MNRTGIILLTGIAVLALLIGVPTLMNNAEQPQETGEATPQDPVAEDPYLWLEEVEGERALAWVEEQNAKTLPQFEDDPRFEDLRQEALEVYTSDERIPYGSIHGNAVYNFWQDDEHVRGIWRRMDITDYAAGGGDWETVLDIDALAKEEDENWVWAGANCLPQSDRCLVMLSRGGGDANVVREFDLETAGFVDGGFTLPEAKSQVSWVDEDTLLVGTDFGEGSLTTSGYPRQVRMWSRGTPLADAPQIHEVPREHVWLWGGASHRPEGTELFLLEGPSFFEQRILHLNGEGEARPLPLPLSVSMQGFMDGKIIVLLRDDWAHEGGTLPGGALIAMDAAASAEAGTPQDLEVILEPTETAFIDAVGGIAVARDTVYVTVLDNVKGRLVAARRGENGWQSDDVAMPADGSLSVSEADPFSGIAFVNYESFLSPDQLYMIQPGAAPRVVRSLPPQFDTEGLVTEQRFATSADGTRIPYFVVRAEDMEFNGDAPTILYGYGGFEISLKPSYVSPLVQSWLERGGVYVVANIRGGGEFGPRWHHAALLENRQRAYDDFAAVAEDLIAGNITSPDHLGILGGSNGGLLVGATFLQRPDLFNAVVSAVPLLDMLRYHKLLAGASWMGEYGDPDDPDMREVILGYSPYQNVREDADYPEVFFTTSTRDDRVHPGHARKMAARMQAMGHDIYYYENTEGGHSAAANQIQRARLAALEGVYFMQKLMDGS